MPLTRRLEQLVKNQRLNLGEAASRLRFPAIAARPAGANFGAVCAATLQRRKLWLEYHARSTDERTERTVSPQRVVHYRETWYLDAWDDSRDALRSFSIDRVLRAVADERWHPEARGMWMEDGSYELRIRYAEGRELVMDILRHGSAVNVLAPDELKLAVRAELAAALSTYAT